jgi:hypothetical protein
MVTSTIQAQSLTAYSNARNNYFRKSTRSNVRAVFQLEGYELEKQNNSRPS